MRKNRSCGRSGNISSVNALRAMTTLCCSAVLRYAKTVCLRSLASTLVTMIYMPSASNVGKAKSQSSCKERQEWSSSMLPSSHRNTSVNTREKHMSLKEYKPGTAFPGVIGLTIDQSSPAWPEPLRAREGVPNVLFIVLDDNGYRQLRCYGSPIETPNLDSLAEGGLRYNNMRTTALCSPTRACIIPGRNHHSNALAAITELATGHTRIYSNIP